MLRAANLPATGMTFRYAAGEVQELWEEVLKGDIKGIISEACDVYTCTMCAIHNNFGIDMPIVWDKTAKEWFHRVDVFKQILHKRGLEFKVEYLRYGANYHKPHKVAKVIELAEADQL